MKYLEYFFRKKISHKISFYRTLRRKSLQNYWKYIEKIGDKIPIKGQKYSKENKDFFKKKILDLKFLQIEVGSCFHDPAEKLLERSKKNENQKNN